MGGRAIVMAYLKTRWTKLASGHEDVGEDSPNQYYGPIKASDLWCKINVPAADWRLKTCPGDGALSVKMISYNLFWWNLFSRHDGGGKSAGKLIARTSGDDLYDFMGFKECDDRDRVMGEAESSGLHADYATIDGGRAIAMAYLKTRWAKLAS